ncbi:MAG: hypothetical protein AAF253_02130 [Pseudomonadota bacterium]
MLLGAVLVGALLVRSDPATNDRLPRLLKMVASSLLMATVLGFFLLLAIMAGGFLVFAIMAGSGFDFTAAGDTPEAFGPAFDTFMATPAGQVSQAAFVLAMAVWTVSIGRAVPFAAASVYETRIIVLEAFGRSRGRGLLLTFALTLALLPGALILGAATLSTIGGGILSAVLAGFGTVLVCVGFAAVSGASVQT